jgi:lantibiotic transport system ATP-binding protein
MVNALTTDQLTRSFPHGGGIRDVSLCVPAGSIYGFLGPNGAGKTTTIRLLLGLLQPERGEIRIFGEHASRHSRAKLAALVESPSLYGHLSGRDNLEVTRRLLGVGRANIDHVLQRVGLTAAADQRAREYSLGMRQRLGLALSLLGNPKILILDEPSNGLDPGGIAQLRALLRSFVENDGLTIFMSSHLLSEVEQLASHVGVLSAGTLLFQGSMGQLRQRAQTKLRVQCDRAAAAASWLMQKFEQASLGQSEGRIQLLSHAEQASGEHVLITTSVNPALINRWLVQAGFEVSLLTVDTVSLEDLFFQLTGATDDKQQR